MSTGSDAGAAARHRRAVGAAGERIAADLLERRGLRIEARNVRVGRDELDLIARDGSRRIAVEVKSAVGRTVDPGEHLDARKAAALHRAMAALDPPASRLDLVTVVFDAAGVAVRWSRNVG